MEKSLVRARGRKAGSAAGIDAAVPYRWGSPGPNATDPPRTPAASAFGRDQVEIGQLAQHALRTGGRIDHEQLHRAAAGVERRVEAAFGDEHRHSRADLL